MKTEMLHYTQHDSAMMRHDDSVILSEENDLLYSMLHFLQM